MARVTLGASILLALASSGCGSRPLATDDSASSETSGVAETSGAETGDLGDGDGDLGDGDGDLGDGDGDGELECPEVSETIAGFLVSPPTPRTAVCAVVEATNVVVYTLTLDCEGEAVSISLDSTLLYLPSPGTMVELDYRVLDHEAGQDRWLALHRLDSPSVLALGGISASSLDPPGTSLAEFWRVLSLSVREAQPCPALPDRCGEQQRLALEVWTEAFGVSTTPVFDHGTWFADFLAFGFTIEVEQATRRVPPLTCEATPEAWFKALAVWFPSD